MFSITSSFSMLDHPNGAYYITKFNNLLQNFFSSALLCVPQIKNFLGFLSLNSLNIIFVSNQPGTQLVFSYRMFNLKEDRVDRILI